jgi:hypothetical protein
VRERERNVRRRLAKTVHFGWLGNGRRRWAVDGDFGQWTLTLGWMATLAWTVTSRWPETGWPATLGSEGLAAGKVSRTKLSCWESLFFYFWKDPVLLNVFEFMHLYDVVDFNWML